MAVAYETYGADLIADLQSQILEYLHDKTNGAAAGDLVEAIRDRHQFLSTSPIVTAIWDLNAQSKISIDGNWKVTLREQRL